jgi:hypothetical protein
MLSDRMQKALNGQVNAEQGLFMMDRELATRQAPDMAVESK